MEFWCFPFYLICQFVLLFRDEFRRNQRPIVGFEAQKRWSKKPWLFYSNIIAKILCFEYKGKDKFIHSCKSFSEVLGH